MRHIGARHVDRRRHLEPRDYLEDPWAFGRRADVAPTEPPGGDSVSRRVALLQHALVYEWNRRGRRPSASELCRRYGVSKQLLSRVALGERWAGETVLAALAEALLAA